MFEREMFWWISFGVMFSIMLALAPDPWGQKGTIGSPVFSHPKTTCYFPNKE